MQTPTQSAPPAMFTIMKRRKSIFPIPATKGAKARMTGTKRVITIARSPYLSKNAWVFSRFFGEKILELGLEKSFGP